MRLQRTLPLSLLILFLLAWTSLASADFQAGEDAYERGDYETALKEWRPLAEQDDASAQTRLGFMYGKGEGVLRDLTEAVRWLRLAADQGNAKAQNELGHMYSNGIGVATDAIEGNRWTRLAAEQGNSDAQLNLARAYLTGEGIKQDITEAIRWWRLAAAQGRASAQNNLGVMYQQGRGLPQNSEEAFHWFRLAAEQGHVGAQYSMGLQYAGQGVIQDYVKAYMWCKLASLAGDWDARSLLDPLAQEMTPAQLAEAQRLVREWKPTTPDASAQGYKPQSLSSDAFEEIINKQDTEYIFGLNRGDWEVYAQRIIHPNGWKTQLGSHNTGTQVMSYDSNTGMGLSVQPIYDNNDSPPSILIVGSYYTLGFLPTFTEEFKKNIEEAAAQDLGPAYSVSASYTKIPPLEGLLLTVAKNLALRVESVEQKSITGNGEVENDKFSPELLAAINEYQQTVGVLPSEFLAFTVEEQESYARGAIDAQYTLTKQAHLPVREEYVGCLNQYLPQILSSAAQFTEKEGKSAWLMPLNLAFLVGKTCPPETRKSLKGKEYKVAGTGAELYKLWGQLERKTEDGVPDSEEHSQKISDKIDKAYIRGVLDGQVFFFHGHRTPSLKDLLNCYNRPKTLRKIFIGYRNYDLFGHNGPPVDAVFYGVSLACELVLKKEKDE